MEAVAAHGSRGGEVALVLGGGRSGTGKQGSRRRRLLLDGVPASAQGSDRASRLRQRRIPRRQLLLSGFDAQHYFFVIGGGGRRRNGMGSGGYLGFT
ncbi:hypothetical protein E2562_008636 [Oryza meyeriana var. granulata]|uniref:Uncharacterized protein n=1 Tax=Oryza meyeriana var. granulata TaxID=110450 RepID=A0A6G1F5I6_9ORYZ|nr:hypothetical protein E2562_008636 [Oryza meyeriana var. granulata]